MAKPKGGNIAPGDRTSTYLGDMVKESGQAPKPRKPKRKPGRIPNPYESMGVG